MESVLAIGLTVVGLVITVATPVIGYTFKAVNKRIDDMKSDTAKCFDDMKVDTEKKIDMEAARRTEANNGLLTLVNLQFNQIKEGLQDVKDEIKSIFPPR